MDLRFEGVIGYSTADAEEATHFFEHTLGLEPAGTEGALRFYALGEGLTVSVDASGGAAGDAPYLLFSSDDVDGGGGALPAAGLPGAGARVGDGGGVHRPCGGGAHGVRRGPGVARGVISGGVAVDNNVSSDSLRL